MLTTIVLALAGSAVVSSEAPLPPTGAEFSAPPFLSLQGPSPQPRVHPYLRAGLLYHLGFDLDLGPNFNFDWGPGLFAAAGVQSAGNVAARGELQYMLRRAEGSAFVSNFFGGGEFIDADMTLHSLLLNGLVVLSPQDRVSPFFGGGAGLSYGVLELEGEDDSNTALELQVLGGLQVRLRDNLTLEGTLSYSYAFHEVETSSGGTDSAPIDIVSFGLGLTLRL